MKQIEYAFRLVHIDNIPHILQYGITKRTSRNADPDYVPIGDATLISTRQSLKIPGTDELIGNYIPFYLGPRSPMLYTIQKGYNGVRQQNPSSLVYCVVRISDIIKGGLKGYFTDGHARSANTVFYENKRLGEINALLCYDNLYRSQWGEDFDNTGEAKRLKSAELLLENDLGPEYIVHFVVYDTAAKEKLIQYGVDPEKVHPFPKFYF